MTDKMQQTATNTMKTNRVLALLLMFVVGCAGSNLAEKKAIENLNESEGQNESAQITETDADTIIVDIPKTLYQLKMIPVKMSDGSILYFSQREVTWDVFDIYAFSRDLSQAQITAGVDAEARPTRPYGAPDQGWGHQNYAAVSMSKLSAIKFAEWLSKTTGRPFRIPSAKEWTEACLLSEISEIEKSAWHRGNSDFQAHEVATKAQDKLGLFDMLGNVSEWVLSDDELNIALGGSHNTKFEEVNCQSQDTQEPFWNNTDPQIPKSEWWLSDVFYVGIRVVMDSN